MDGSQGNIVEWKVPVPKGYKLYNYVYTMFLKYQNSRDGEQISDWQGFRKEKKAGMAMKR